MENRSADRNFKSFIVITEILAGILGCAVLIYFLRAMLILGETTFIHDNIYWNFPVFKFFAENIARGHFPFWNPYSHGGEPFYIMLGQFRLLEPIALLVAYFGQFVTNDIVILFNWNRICQSLIIAFGVYVVFRQIAGHFFIRLTLIPILLYSSFMLCSFRQDGIINLFLWTPFITHFLLRIIYYKDYRWHNWLFLASLIGLSWQSYFFAGVWIFLLFFFTGILLFRRELLTALFGVHGNISKIAASTLIIIVMMAPNIVLIYEKDKIVFPPRMVDSHLKESGVYNREPQQYEGEASDIVEGIRMPYFLVAATGTFSQPSNFLQLMSPRSNVNIVGPSQRGNVWGRPSEAYAYIGLLPWAIALLGMLGGKHELRKIWLLIVIGFGLLMLGPPGMFHKLMYYIYPPVWFIRHTHCLVLFLLFAIIFFYILGLRLILLAGWRSNIFFQDKTKSIFKSMKFVDNYKIWDNLSFCLFCVCFIFLFYAAMKVELEAWALKPNYLFLFVILMFALGWLLKKCLGTKNLFTILLISQIITVLICSQNSFSFLIYFGLVFGVPFAVFALRNNYPSSKFMLFLVLLFFVSSLIVDLLYNLKSSEWLFHSQQNPKMLTDLIMAPANPSVLQERKIAPKGIYGVTAQAIRYPAMVNRRTYVFSPSFHENRREEHAPSKDKMSKEITGPRFSNRLSNLSWNSMFLLGSYFSLIHSGIQPDALKEMFGLGMPMFQTKKKMLAVENGEIINLLKGIEEHDLTRILRDYVFVEKSDALNLLEPGTYAVDERSLMQHLHQKARNDGNSCKKTNLLFKSENFCTSDLKVTASSYGTPTEHPSMLVDGVAKSFWGVSLKEIGEAAWVNIDFGEGNEKLVNWIRARPRRDCPGQFFKRAVLEGSHNAITWHKIGVIAQQNQPKTNDWISWFVPNEQTYRYYRIYISDGHHIDSDLFLSFAELEMYQTSIIPISDSSLKLNLETNEPVILYWADGYDKWWRAYVNGKEVPIYRANVNFKAIALPKGENHIRFVYDPGLFKGSLFIFYGTIILSFVAALFCIFSERSRRLRPNLRLAPKPMH